MSRSARQVLGAVIGALLLCALVYGLVLDDAGRFGVRWFWNCLVNGRRHRPELVPAPFVYARAGLRPSKDALEWHRENALLG